MSRLRSELKKRRLSLAGEVCLVAALFGLAITTFGWFWVGRFSPLNDGVFPDVHASPDVIIWVLANFPAALLFWNLFGKNGPEWSYFLCVFMQWFVVGIGVGGSIAVVRRVWKDEWD
jgi:hypothetical protein